MIHETWRMMKDGYPVCAYVREPWFVACQFINEGHARNELVRLEQLGVTGITIERGCCPMGGGAAPGEV